MGSLLYIITSHLDIAYSLGVCAKYQSRSKESHVQEVKRILKYVSGLTEDTNTTIVGFPDANWVGCVDDQKSNLGGGFFIGNNLVAWYSKKQTSTSLLIAEAEYITMEVTVLNFGG